MSGHPKAIRQGFAALRNGGTAALLGIPSEPVALDLPNDIIFKGATVLGINGRKMFETWYQVENFLLIRPPEPRTHHHPPSAAGRVRARPQAHASRGGNQGRA